MLDSSIEIKSYLRCSTSKKLRPSPMCIVRRGSWSEPPLIDPKYLSAASTMAGEISTSSSLFQGYDAIVQRVDVTQLGDRRHPAEHVVAHERHFIRLVPAFEVHVGAGGQARQIPTRREGPNSDSARRERVGDHTYLAGDEARRQQAGGDEHQRHRKQ